MPHWPGAGADSLFSTVNPFPQGANVTYASVRNADLGPLDSTVTSLATLTAKLGEMEQDAAAMNGMAHGSLWTGLNATVSKAYIHRTAGKFTDAHTQAEALHSILRDLLTDLRGCQDGLIRLETNSEAEGFRISPEGVISSAQPPHLRLSQLNAGVGTGGIGEPDPESVPPETQQAMWHAQTRINEIIEKAGESDTIAARALTDLLAEGNGRFVHTDLTGIDDARENQVQQDAEAVTFLAGKENKTAADWRMLGDYFALHADNPEFAHYVVDTIGLDNYLALVQDLDRSGSELASANVDVAAIKAGMGNTLNTVMQPSIDVSTHSPGSAAYNSWLVTPEGQAYAERLEELNALGPKTQERHSWWAGRSTEEKTGYDLFLDLMESADKPMNDVFYYDMLDGMVAAEKGNPAVWVGDRYPETENGWDPRNNGTDRLLGLGAQNNVDATTLFFDPAENDNLEYFTGDSEESRKLVFSRLPHLFGDHTYNSAPGLNSALETATTGRPSGGTAWPGYEGHSDANIRIAEQLWNAYAEDPARSRGDVFTPDLRPALGTVAADYIADVSYAAYGVSEKDSQPREAMFDRVHSSSLLWEVGKDPDSYRNISVANQALLYSEMDAIVTANSEDVDEIAKEATRTANRTSHIAGIMTGAYADARYEEQLATDAEHNASIGNVQQAVEFFMGGAVYGSISNGGMASMTDAVQGSMTDALFDKFYMDNSITSADQAAKTYNTSRVATGDSAAAAATAALESAGITDSVDYDNLIEDIEVAAMDAFDHGTIRKHAAS
ncbi:hypothetical protein ACFV5N_06940 [Streptomyces sp. NPDC059853]|uniref:hypothetical protein n=1 Tax=unclassified Streptomyces TaxID=2593676 RepID=UPI0002E1C676|nr:hypothetical protein [Streptomyces sp. AA0539]